MFSIFLVILVVALRTSLGIGFKVKDVTLLFSVFLFLPFCFLKLAEFVLLHHQVMS